MRRMQAFVKARTGLDVLTTRQEKQREDKSNIPPEILPFIQDIPNMNAKMIVQPEYLDTPTKRPGLTNGAKRSKSATTRGRRKGSIDVSGKAVMADYQNHYHESIGLRAKTPLSSVAPGHREDYFGINAMEDAAPAPPDFTPRGIHIPTRTR
jgi:hypothetical protein